MSTPPKAATHTAPDARRTTAEALIAAADLPTPVAERVAAIVRATRLWKSERADIARELIAHAQDALAAGRTPEDTADALGDPATIAPLLRRSAKRKRPWHWHARRRTLQAVGISLLAMIGVYAVLFVRFNTGSPSITHNYLAELNERNAAFGPDQRALEAYEALHVVWDREHRELMAAEAAADTASGLPPADRPMNALFIFPISRPDMPGYDDIVAAHARLRPEIDAAVEASRRPTLGFIYSDRSERTVVDGVWVTEVLPPSDDPALSAPLIEVLLPWLGQSRGIAQLIAFDALLAARNGDADRAAESFAAVFDTARLVGREHTLLASLVALSIQNLAESVLLRTLHEHPSLFNESHLTALAHTAANSGRAARDLDFATERRYFGDFLQRAFTDDGHGDGRLTSKGLSLLRRYDDVTFDADLIERPVPIATRFTGPVAMALAGSRAEQLAMYDRILDHAEADLRTPPSSAEHARLKAEFNTTLERLRDNPRYFPVSLLAPAFNKSVITAHKSEAHTDATLTTIAVHIHRLRTGRWPDTLDELTPHLLPTIPADPFDPGRPIKYRVIEGMPRVYFAGADGTDNHAARSTDNAQRDVSSLELRYAGDAATGPNVEGTDWIVFPVTP